jgi:hypothetical protein
MKIKIEKGVPIPQTRGNRNLYPFKKMGVGDSFFILDKSNPKKTLRNVCSAASFFKKKNPKYKFHSRSYVTGVRVWRVE